MNKDTKLALIIGGIILAIMIIVPTVIGAIWGAQNYNSGWGMMGSGMMGLGWGFMGIFMVVFWGLVIWGIVSLVRGAGYNAPSQQTHTESAIDILKKRYASGEITKDEFETKKKDLI